MDVQLCKDAVECRAGAACNGVDDPLRAGGCGSLGAGDHGGCGLGCGAGFPTATLADHDLGIVEAVG